MKQDQPMILLMDSNRGTYIPRDFVEDEVLRGHFGLTEENKEHWEACLDPDNEWYWGAWDWVENHAKHTSELGNYILHQDGDLWALDLDRMTNEEKEGFGFEDYDSEYSCDCDGGICDAH